MSVAQPQPSGGRGRAREGRSCPRIGSTAVSRAREPPSRPRCSSSSSPRRAPRRTPGPPSRVGSGSPRRRRHQPSPSNPLDPLTADEIQTTFTVIEQVPESRARDVLPDVKLSEPPKADVLAWSPGQPFQRRAFANVFDRSANKLYEAIVDLRTNQLLSWTTAGRRAAGRLPHGVDGREQDRPQLRAVEDGDPGPRHRPEGRVRRHLGAG
jgi:hypothetical protein